MPTTEQPLLDKGARFVAFVKRNWPAINAWGVRGGSVIFIVIIILARIKIVPAEVALPIVSTVVFLFLSEQLRDSRKESDRQSTAIKSIIENASQKLYALHDCVEDFDATLRRIQPREKVVIQHLGLDLTDAWQDFEPFLRTHCNLTDIDYRLLILTDEAAKIAGANEEVRSWSANVPRTLDRIRKEVNLIINEFEGKKIQFEVRKYWAMPVVHGFRIVSPMSRCYVAICRWGGLDYQRYDWGKPQYHKIFGDPSDAVSRDMLKIYDGYFNYLWKNSDPVFTLPSPAESEQQPSMPSGGPH